MLRVGRVLLGNTYEPIVSALQLADSSLFLLSENRFGAKLPSILQALERMQERPIRMKDVRNVIGAVTGVIMVLKAFRFVLLACACDLDL